VENLIADLLESDVPKALELVRETAEHLFDLATANAEPKRAEHPVPLLHARLFVEEEDFLFASVQVQERAEDLLDEIEQRLDALVDSGKSYPYGLANLDPHLRNFVVDEGGQMKMIDFDNFRVHYDPYYSAAFLYSAVDSDPYAKRPTVLQRAVLAGVDWEQPDASERFALGLAAMELGSLGLEMPREEIPHEEKLALCERDLETITATLARDWVAAGHDARLELERPELVSVAELSFAPAFDERPTAVELEH
jgi:hypothetical protein